MPPWRNIMRPWLHCNTALAHYNTALHRYNEACCASCDSTQVPVVILVNLMSAKVSDKKRKCFLSCDSRLLEPQL